MSNECLFRKAKCKPIQEHKKLLQLRQLHIDKFIYAVCSMCVKKQYASSKELRTKKHYVVVNTL
jgi:hypothetical protein